MGIDSLIAVEIRTWFLKNLEVNMPVLKILSGASIGELLDHAMETLSHNLTPNIDGVSSDVKESAPQSDTEKNKPSSISNSPGRSSSQSELESYASEQESKSSSERPVLERTEIMSFGQSMFWFVKVLLEDQTTLNHTGCYHMKGPVRAHDLESAIVAVGRRHEALRTCFFMGENGQPMQGVMKSALLHLERKEVNGPDDVTEEFARIKSHVFDIEYGSTIRILLLTQSPTDHYLIIGCHHINIDGISQQVLMSDLEKAYTRQPLSLQVLQYPDFSLTQREDYKAGKWKTEISYWKKEFSDFPPTLALLPMSQVTFRRPLSAYFVHRTDFRLDSNLTARIHNICRQFKVTPFYFYLAAFRALLYRHTESEDLCIGIGDGNRTDDHMLDSIGPYINLLPLRFHSYQGQAFSHILKEARSKSYSALANSRLPFEVLLNELSVPRSAAHSPLFQAFIDYRQGAREKQAFGECELEAVTFEDGRTAHDISLDIVDNPGMDCLLMLMVQQDLYARRDAEILMKSYTNLLEAFAQNPNVPVGGPELYRQEDVEDAIQLGRGKHARNLVDDAKMLS